ncbi:Protein SOK1 [Rhodotorula toruloides]|nr:Protein SOK1 [Rhodotorula toruloides]KAJ8292785.1 Protein SOK1 [Rhodotorula toruloides]
MESPYPPQLSLPSSGNASSQEAGASASPSGPPASLGNNTTATDPASEPRQTHRKRTRTADETSQAGFECGPDGIEASGSVLSDDDARPRGLSEGGRRSRGELARRLADRARVDERRGGWMTRSVSDEGVETTAGEVTNEHVEKRRRLEGLQLCEGGERERTPTRRSRPAPIRIDPAYHSCLPSPTTTTTNLPSSHLGVFPTALAQSVDVAQTSTLLPPPASPRLPPPSADIPQLPFSAASSSPPSLRTPFTSAPPAARSPQRRRAKSLPASLCPVHPALLSPTCYSIQRRKLSTSPRPTSGSSPASVAAPLPFPPTPPNQASAPPKLFSQEELVALHAFVISKAEGVLTTAGITTASLAPPITKDTLQELDLSEIMRNPQLRHDVVFDPNLMFRPNYDGERGERKRLTTEQYWVAVAREVSIGCRCAAFRNNSLLPCICSCFGDETHPVHLSSRLPSRIFQLIVELRAIISTLLPGSPTPNSPTPSSAATFDTSSLSAAPSSAPTHNAREAVAEVLDPVHLTQQIAHGVADIAALARFLGSTLKMHCAPMRDELVDAMVKVTCEGEGIVKGLRLCFEILELMKLDIANHQLRSLRPYLVSTALDFERRFFQSSAARRRRPLKVFERVSAWLESSATRLSAKGAAPRKLGVGDVDKVVAHGLLDLIYPALNTSSPPPSSLASLPETLMLDSYRLKAFHADSTDLTVIYLLAMLFQQLAVPARPSTEDMERLCKELWIVMTTSTGSPSSLVGPAASILGIPQGPPGHGISKLSSSAWRQGMQDVLLQLAARAKQVNNVDAQPVSPAPLPNADTLKLVTSYFETNVKADGKLFQLLQKRLRETIELAVEEELAKETERGPLAFTGWWQPSKEPATMTTGSVRRGSVIASHKTGARPDANLMAASSPVRGRKRSLGDRDQDVESTPSLEHVVAEKRQRTELSLSAKSSPFEAALQRNGLTALSGEVRLLAGRIAKVASFNISVYRPLYEAMLARLPPSDLATNS